MNLQIPAHAFTHVCLSSWRVSGSNEQQTPTSTLRGVNRFSAVGGLVILRTPGRFDVGRAGEACSCGRVRVCGRACGGSDSQWRWVQSVTFGAEPQEHDGRRVAGRRGRQSDRQGKYKLQRVPVSPSPLCLVQTAKKKPKKNSGTECLKMFFLVYFCLSVLWCVNDLWPCLPNVKIFHLGGGFFCLFFSFCFFFVGYRKCWINSSAVLKKNNSEFSHPPFSGPVATGTWLGSRLESWFLIFFNFKLF